MNKEEFMQIKPEFIALVHEDERRSIYDPGRILEGLEELGQWHIHNIMVLNKEYSQLGGHYHKHHTALFTPTGGIEIKIVDVDNVNNKAKHILQKGQRILLPPRIAHCVTGESGKVMLEQGTQEFNPDDLIPCDPEILKILDSL